MKRLGLGRVAVGVLAGSCALVACKKDDEPYLFGPDQDGDGWPFELDCNDRDDTIFPSADDIPGDGIDQDCSGSDAGDAGMGGAGGAVGSGGSDAGGGASSGGKDAGSGGGVSEIEDADGDGFGVDEDCDDTRQEVFPGAVEIVLNGVDEDCDGSDLAGATSGVQLKSEGAIFGEAPALAVVEVDGEARLMAVWAGSTAVEDVRQDVLGQLFDFDGAPVGDRFVVDSLENNAKQNVSLVAGDGLVLAAWKAVGDPMDAGIFAQQLQADGSVVGKRHGIDGELQAGAPTAAYGAWDQGQPGWAVAWQRSVDATGHVRAFSVGDESVLIDIEDLGGESDLVSSASVVGTEEGFLTIWEGPIDDETRGIWGQERLNTGLPAGDAFIISREETTDAAVAYDGNEFFVGYRLSDTFGFVEGKRFTMLGDEVMTDGIRLSTESKTQAGLRFVPTADGFFGLWNDFRHQVNVPSVYSVYGNHLSDGAPVWPASRAFYASTTSVLGGVVEHDGVVYFTVMSAGEVWLHEIKL